MARTIRTSDRADAIKEAVRGANRRPGQQLPNGATIVAARYVKTLGHAEEHQVLAVTEGFQPYVIWTRVIGVEQLSDGRSWGTLDFCFDGMYFRLLDDAVACWVRTPDDDEFGAKVEEAAA